MKNYSLIKQNGSFVIYRKIETNLNKIISKYELEKLINVIDPENYKVEYVIKGDLIRELKQFDNFTISANLLTGEKEYPNKFTPILYFPGSYSNKISRIEAYLLTIIFEVQKLRYVNKFHSLKL